MIIHFFLFQSNKCFFTESVLKDFKLWDDGESRGGRYFRGQRKSR